MPGLIIKRSYLYDFIIICVSGDDNNILFEKVNLKPVTDRY